MWIYLIAAAFLAHGLLITVNKAFEMSGSSGSRLGYLCVYFGTGLAVSLVLHAWRRPVIRRSDISLGLGIGVFSVLAGLFLLRALAKAPAILVFPCVTAGNVALVVPLGAVFFRERLGWKGWLGILFGVIALILMV